MAGINPERQEKARLYARALRRLSIAELVLDAAFISVLLVSPLSVHLRNLPDCPLPLKAALYFAALSACFGVVFLPLSLYGGFVLPSRFGLITQSLWSWVGDVLKRGTRGLLLGTGLVMFIYMSLDAMPGLWWILTGTLFILLSLVMTNIAPIIIMPLFYRMEPLADHSLRERLERLADRSGTKVRGIFTINLSSKGTIGNAALMGLGNTKRIVFGDTILMQYTPDEIELIMAHELGHQVHHDVAKLIIIQSAVILVGLYLVHLFLTVSVPFLGFQNVADLAALPLLVAVIVAFTAGLQPLSNACNRHIEAIADRYALSLTGNAEGFITVMAKLTDQNLSEAKPSRWVELLFYDHPSYHRRVAMAMKYMQKERNEAYLSETRRDTVEP